MYRLVVEQGYIIKIKNEQFNLEVVPFKNPYKP